MRTPKWIERVAVDSIHFDTLREHGGLRGIRDEGALEEALQRPKDRWDEEDKPDLARLAAGYGHAIATERPYRDGNTRVAFLVMAAFLDRNGRTVSASEEEVVTVMVALGDDQISRKKLAAWIRERLSPD